MYLSFQSGLALANETRLPKVAKNCLDEMTLFLMSITESEEDIADASCRNYAFEILLGLSLLRGNVTYILRWIELCVTVSLRGSCGGVLDQMLYKYWMNVLLEDEPVRNYSSFIKDFFAVYIVTNAHESFVATIPLFCL